MKTNYNNFKSFPKTELKPGELYKVKNNLVFVDKVTTKTIRLYHDDMQNYDRIVMFLYACDKKLSWHPHRTYSFLYEDKLVCASLFVDRRENPKILSDLEQNYFQGIS